MDYVKEGIIKEKANLFLYFAVVIVNLTCFTCGTAFTWSSPVVSQISASENNPSKMAFSETEISWIVSLMPLGAAVGPYLGGYLADKVGRRKTLIVSILPFILAYLILAFANNLYLYYVARLIKGICVGLYLTVVPMYVGEVAEINNRGILGCFTVCFVTIGSLFVFIVGPYIPLMWFNLSCIVVPIGFLAVFTILVPESPCYLILIGKHDEARRSLSKLRRGNIENELAEITQTVKESMAAKGGISDILKTKHLYKALCLSLGLMIIQQLTAISVINFYMQLIFQDAGTSMSPAVSVIIVGVIQVVGTTISTLVVDMSGRRPLLISSTTLTSLTLLILSVYFYLQTAMDVSHINWLPMITLMVYMLFYNLGIGPLAFAVMGEIYPPHVKSAGSSLSVSCCYMFSFFAAKLFPYLGTVVGTWFSFLFFAIGNILGVIFIWFCMPETKGKTLLEIMEFFK